MNRDLLSAGFLMVALGIGIMIFWARKARADREQMIGSLVGE